MTSFAGQFAYHRRFHHVPICWDDVKTEDASTQQKRKIWSYIEKFLMIDSTLRFPALRPTLEDPVEDFIAAFQFISLDYRTKLAANPEYADRCRKKWSELNIKANSQTA